MQNHWKAMKWENRLKNRVQITSISVNTKSEKQAGTLQLSKYVAYICIHKLHKLYGS